MAAGPLARIIAQVIVPVVAVLARAIPAAYAQALKNARSSPGGAAQAASIMRKTMSREEALQILNLTESEVTPAAIRERYEKYFAANAVKKGGGSFYLQSKVVRAKELLDEYEKDHPEGVVVEEEEENEESSTTTKPKKEEMKN